MQKIQGETKLSFVQGTVYSMLLDVYHLVSNVPLWNISNTFILTVYLLYHGELPSHIKETDSQK